MKTFYTLSTLAFVTLIIVGLLSIDILLLSAIIAIINYILGYITCTLDNVQHSDNKRLRRKTNA